MQHEVSRELEERIQTMRALCSALRPMERREIQCRLGIVPGAGNESGSRVNLHLGAYIVRIVGITRVDIMELSKYDETPLGRKLRRRTVRIGGAYVKTRTYLGEVGAKRDTSENKDKAYWKARKENGSYWFLLEIGCIEAAKRNRDRRKRGLK